MKTHHKENMLTLYKNNLLFYIFPHLQKQPGLVHAFSSRLGGVSQGCCTSLNLAYTHPEDNTANVNENWRRFATAVGFDYKRAVLTQQTHSTNIHYACMKDAGRGFTRSVGYCDIDALITDVSNLPLITYHADCAPLFFYAPYQHLIGLAHAGWRGTAANIAGAMVERFSQYGVSPAELLAGIGPSAGPCCYQVGREVVDAFASFCGETNSFLSLQQGAMDKYMLDIWQANRCLLLQAGLQEKNIMISGLCTICRPDVFFSHRAQGTARGTMAAVIMLKEENQ